jgi:hypothetical protein
MANSSSRSKIDSTIDGNTDLSLLEFSDTGHVIAIAPPRRHRPVKAYGRGRLVILFFLMVSRRTQNYLNKDSRYSVYFKVPSSAAERRLRLTCCGGIASSLKLLTVTVERYQRQRIVSGLKLQQRNRWLIRAALPG